MKTPFQTALAYSLEKMGWGAKSRVAKKIGKSQQLISAMATGVSEGSESTRRDLANYFNLNYEDFLELGRSLLNAGTPQSEQCHVSSDAAKYGTEVDSLIKMTREILESNTDYSQSLSANIKSFHTAMQTQRDLAELKREHAELKKDLAEMKTHNMQLTKSIERIERSARFSGQEDANGNVKGNG